MQTLASAVHSKTASGERIEMDPQGLYQRLLVSGINDIPVPDLMNISVRQSYAHADWGQGELIHRLMELVPECVVSTTLNKDMVRADISVEHAEEGADYIICRLACFE